MRHLCPTILRLLLPALLLVVPVGGGPGRSLWSVTQLSGGGVSSPASSGGAGPSPATNPVLGSYFTWGGGPNVSLGAQPAGVVWGVHATASASASANASAVRLSWLMGAPSTSASSPGVLVATPSPAAFTPAGLSFSASVAYGPPSAQPKFTGYLSPRGRVYVRGDPNGPP